MGFTSSFCLQISLKKEQTTALILKETDSVPKACMPRPEPPDSHGVSLQLLSFRTRNSIKLVGTVLKSQPRGTFLVSSPQIRAQIFTVPHLSKCSFLIV